MTLACAHCLIRMGDRIPRGWESVDATAVTMYDGTAVCRDDLLRLVRADKQR